MRKALLIAVLLFIAAGNTYAQNDSALQAQQIIRIEQAMMNALPGDTTVWVKYLDPQFYIITEDGSGLNRKDFLAGFGPFPKGYSGHITVVKPVLTFHGNTAVIHYVSDEYETVFGQQLHTTYGTADTYYKSDTNWMLLASQVFEIPQLPTPIHVSATTLQQYAGTYILTEGKTAVISVKNDTLFIAKNNSTPEALFAETPTVFFRMKDTRGRKIFVHGAAGVMLMLERRNGQDLAWKKQ